MTVATAGFVLQLNPAFDIPAQYTRRADRGDLTVQRGIPTGPCAYCGRDDQHTWILFDDGEPAACDVTS